MAGYQNNMRYGRPGSIYQQRNTGCSCEQRMPELRDRCSCEQPMPERHDNCGCNERQETKRDCGCGHRRDEFARMPLAMAYVPWQTWCEIYDICEGFQRGTIFRELDMPFHGRGGCNR